MKRSLPPPTRSLPFTRFMKTLLRILSLSLLPVLVHAADRPNILFVAVDDLRPEFGAYGAGYVK